MAKRSDGRRHLAGESEGARPLATFQDPGKHQVSGSKKTAFAAGRVEPALPSAGCGGSNVYREHGLLGSGFGGLLFPSFYSVTSEPFLHEDWDMQNKCLWHETHPWGKACPATPDGLAQAHRRCFQYAKWAPACPGSERENRLSGEVIGCPLG